MFNEDSLECGCELGALCGDEEVVEGTVGFFFVPELVFQAGIKGNNIEGEHAEYGHDREVEEEWVDPESFLEILVKVWFIREMECGRYVASTAEMVHLLGVFE